MSEKPKRIMYVCESCAEFVPEDCGHYDWRDIGVTHDGRWLCETCWDEYHDCPGEKPAFKHALHPPEYRPARR